MPIFTQYSILKRKQFNNIEHKNIKMIFRIIIIIYDWLLIVIIIIIDQWL